MDLDVIFLIVIIAVLAALLPVPVAGAMPPAIAVLLFPQLMIMFRVQNDRRYGRSGFRTLLVLEGIAIFAAAAVYGVRTAQ